MEFIFPIFPVRGRGVYTPDIPLRGRGVYTPYIPYTGRGICSLANKETLLELDQVEPIKVGCPSCHHH